MTDLTPETLAEDVRRHFSSARDGSINARLRDRILDSLAAEKAAREEAERDRAMEEAYCNHARDRAETLEEDVKREKARADKAEQERDEAEAALKAESEVRGDGLAADLAAAVRRADAAGARVSALEGERDWYRKQADHHIGRGNRAEQQNGELAGQVAALEAGIERAVEAIRSGKEWDAEDTLRALTEKGANS